MSPVVRSLPLVLFGLSFAAGSNAVEFSFQKSAEQLAPNVSSITSCSNKEGSALHRLVVYTQGVEHVSSEVFLQWLEWCEKGPRVLKSVLVAEMSSGMWSVDDAVVLSRKNCAFRLSAHHTYSSKPSHFDVKPAGVGTYSLKELGRR